MCVSYAFYKIVQKLLLKFDRKNKIYPTETQIQRVKYIFDAVTLRKNYFLTIFTSN